MVLDPQYKMCYHARRHHDNSSSSTNVAREGCGPDCRLCSALHLPWTGHQLPRAAAFHRQSWRGLPGVCSKSSQQSACFRSFLVGLHTLSSELISSSNFPPQIDSPPFPVPVGSPAWTIKSLTILRSALTGCRAFRLSASHNHHRPPSTQSICKKACASMLRSLQAHGAENGRFLVSIWRQVTPVNLRPVIVSPLC